MGTSGSTCTLITASAALNTLTAAVYDIAATLTVRRNRELATWHALHQGKEKETILERREYGTMRCMMCC